MPNYPSTIDDDVSLFLAVNNARTRLTSTISDSTFTIPVVTTSGFPNQGFITILTNPDDITEAEAIRYEGLSPTTFSGVERGAGGTFPRVHAVGNFVDLTVMAEHHNELKDAIIALEQILGVSGSHNFVPKDIYGNAIVSGTLTAQNLIDAGWITTSGSAIIYGPGSFNEDVYFAKDILVSGTATFGTLPSSTIPEAIVAFDDIGGTGTNTSFVSKLTTASLPVGDNLVLYRGNIGWDPTTTNTGQIEVRSIFAGVELGIGAGNTTVKAGHGHGAEVAGFKVVTGDAVSTASIQTRTVTGSSRIYQWGAAGLVVLPLAEMGMVEGTDYWYNNGSDTVQTTNSTTFTTITSLNITAPDAGDYVLFFSVEMVAGIQDRTRCQMDGVTVFTQAESGLNTRQPGAGAVVVNLTAGSHTAVVQHSCNNGFGATSDSYRARIFILRASSFSQIQYARSAVDQTISSSTFAQLVNVGSLSHVPVQQEQVLILGTAGHFSTDDDTSASYQIVNTTDAESYAVDSGMRVYNHASDDVTNRQSFFFRTLENVNTQKDFEIQHRRYNGASTTTTTDAALIVMGLSQPIMSSDIPVTTIAGNKITTHEIVTDVITASQLTVTGVLDASQGVSYLGQTSISDLSANNIAASGTLTVSGVPVNIGNSTIPDPLNIGTISASTSITISGSPVSTGTIDTQLLDDTYVNVDGDQMSGNLDMAGNNIYNAGVVVMQDDAPTITTSGLLWFDTDAPGLDMSGNINLPGGFLGAYLTSTSGIDIPDDGDFHIFTWDTEEFDKGGWHDDAYPHRLVVPSGVTYVQAIAGIRFPANSTGDRRVSIMYNQDTAVSENQIATTIADSTITASTPYVVTVTSPVLTVSGGDFFTVLIRQTSTSTLNVGSATIPDTFFSVAAIDTRGVPGVNSVNLLQGDINLVPGSGVNLYSNSQTGEITVAVTGTIVGVFDPTSNQTITGDWDFSSSLTVSGQPVSTGTVGGGGAGTITNINTVATGPGVTITGTGGISTITSGNIITITAPDNIYEGFRGALVSVSSGTSIPPDDATVPVGWDTVSYDTDGFFSPVFPERFTVPSGINKIKLHAQISWLATSTTGDRRLLIRKNNSGLGTDPQQGQIAFVTNMASVLDISTGGQQQQQVHTTAINVVPGDYFDVRGRQGSPGNLDIGSGFTWFAIEVADPVATTANHVNTISGSFTQALTVSGVPVHTSSGLTAVRTFYTAPTSGASPTTLNTVVVEGGIIRTWSQV